MGVKGVDMSKCFKTADFHYTCKECGKKTSMAYLISIADRKRRKDIKCTCGAEIGTLSS